MYSTPAADPEFPVGGTDPFGDANLQHSHFLVETCAKTKELGPVRGVGASGTPWICHCAPSIRPIDIQRDLPRE